MRLYQLYLTHKKKIFISVFVALIAGFAMLSYFVMFTPPSFIDLFVSEEIQERHNSLLDSFMKLISWFGVVPISVIMVVITSCIFLLLHYRREALFTLLTLVSGAISSGLKIVINRPRPTQDLVTIIEKAQHQSFPSGHTLFYTVFFGFVLIIMGNRKSYPNWLRITVAVLCTLMIFLGPVSRVYLGAHWFTDVLGGFVLGIIYLFILGYFYLFKTPPKAAPTK